ncbi:MAG: Kelch repeat-containing protein [Planctomycetia bacterium]
MPKQSHRLVYAVGLLCAAAASYSVVALEDAPPVWVKETDAAGWQPRDSQGEVVYKDRLWLFGGWFDSFHAPPRDVWSSADGRSWDLVEKEAPWRHSDLPMTVVHDDKMWLMGGWTNGRLPGHEASREVWNSTDGKSWTQTTAAADWSARLAGGLVAHDGKMWILGGGENYYFGDDSDLKNDVWSSRDGKTWTQATPTAGWSPRAYHQAASYAGKLWVLGGGNYVPTFHAKNDVWCSADGVNWECTTANAPWPPRLWFSTVVYRDRLWVLGGWTDKVGDTPAHNWGDVWSSADGKTWTEFKAPTVWKERHEHSAYVFKDRLWVAGGHAQPLSNEVWSLFLPPDYFKKE